MAASPALMRTCRHSACAPRCRASSRAVARTAPSVCPPPTTARMVFIALTLCSVTPPPERRHAALRLSREVMIGSLRRDGDFLLVVLRLLGLGQGHLEDALV